MQFFNQVPIKTAAEDKINFAISFFDWVKKGCIFRVNHLLGIDSDVISILFRFLKAEKN